MNVRHCEQSRVAHMSFKDLFQESWKVPCFPLGAIGFVYVRTRELLRIILWFGSFLMCFPTFILKARKLSILVTVERTAVNATKGPRLNIFMFCSPQWLDWMLWVWCFCKTLHCHERKERYHLKVKGQKKWEGHLFRDCFFKFRDFFFGFLPAYSIASCSASLLLCFYSFFCFSLLFFAFLLPLLFFAFLLFSLFCFSLLFLLFFAFLLFCFPLLFFAFLLFSLFLLFFAFFAFLAFLCFSLLFLLFFAFLLFHEVWSNIFSWFEADGHAAVVSVLQKQQHMMLSLACHARVKMSGALCPHVSSLWKRMQWPKAQNRGRTNVTQKESIFVSYNSLARDPRNNNTNTTLTTLTTLTLTLTTATTTATTRPPPPPTTTPPTTTPTPTPTTVTVTTNNCWNVSLQLQNPASTVRNVAVKCCTYGGNADSSSKMLQRAWKMDRTCCKLLQIPWKIQWKMRGSNSKPLHIPWKWQFPAPKCCK